MSFLSSELERHMQEIADEPDAGERDILLDRYLYPDAPPLTAHQEHIYRKAAKHRFLWWQGARGIAKSYTLGRRANVKMVQSRRKFIYTGPSYRQSRFPFKYQRDLVFESHWLMKELAKDVTENNERSEIRFKNGSSAVALPASGSKIHGERGTDLQLTEFFDYPEDLYTRTVKPMLAIMGSTGPNSIIWESTAGYEYQFAFKELQHVLAEIEKNPQGPYYFVSFDVDSLRNETGYSRDVSTGEWLPQKGWPFDWAIVESDREIDPEIYKQQYKCIWLKVMGTFYEMAVLGQENLKRGIIRRQGVAGKQYVAGYDYARSLKGRGDDTGLAIWEIDMTGSVPPALVMAKKWNDLTANVAARELSRYLQAFGVSRLVMDYKGGGVLIADELKRLGYTETDDPRGRAIIQPFPNHPSTINEGHHVLRSAFEAGLVFMPARPEDDDTDLAESYEAVKLALAQFGNLTTTPLPSGFIKFDSPQRKDLAYAVMYGYYGVHQLIHPPKVETPDPGSPIVQSDLGRVMADPGYSGLTINQDLVDLATRGMSTDELDRL
jgi:hypothetical protein